MAHELEVADGRAVMAYAGEAPWHSEETRPVLVTDPAIIADPTRFLAEARMNGWKVTKVPTFIQDTKTAAGQTGGYIQTPGGFATVREGTDGRILGAGVGEDYTPVQNEDVAEWFRPFVAAGLKCSTAFSMRGGSRCAMVCEIPDAAGAVTGSDEVRAYLCLVWSHDGSLAVRIVWSAIRMVCANTVRAALEAASSRILKIKHTRNAVVALAQAQQLVDVARQTFAVTLDQYRFLASRSFDAENLRAYIREVEGLPAAVPEGEDLSTRRENKLDALVSLALAGKGQDLPGARGTWWGAYNGVTEYLTHQAGTSKTTQVERVESNLVGAGAATNDRALALAVDYAQRA